MKKLLVAVAGLVAGFIAIVAVAVVDYQFTWPPTFPATPRPSLRASADPAVIARGEYLFHVAAHCTHCHSPMAEHWGKAVGLRVAPRDGTEIPLGPLVILRPPNITPDLETGIGAWSDADLVRVIRPRHPPRRYAGAIDGGRWADERCGSRGAAFLYVCDAIANDTGPVYRPAGWRPE